MKIALLAYGKQCSGWFIKNWQKHYINSETTLPAVLFCDSSLSKEVRSAWKFEIIQCNQKINLIFPTMLDNNYETIFYGNILRQLAFQYVGPCIIVDYDSILIKKLNWSMIPKCDFGLVLKTKISKRIANCGQPIPHWIFDEFTFVDECYSAPQIIRKDYFSIYIKCLEKYISKMYDLPGGYWQYCESILCLTHKITNGVYLQPEWNWLDDSMTSNKNVIFEHYAELSGKKKLLNKEENIPQIHIS